MRVKNNEKDISKAYEFIQNYLTLNGCTTRNKIASDMSMSTGAITRALKHGRRSFDSSSDDISMYVLSGPDGLFLARDDINTAIAWYFHFLSFSRSLECNVRAIGVWLQDNYPDDMKLAELRLRGEEDNDDEEYSPWGVFDSLI